jgi:hypothetical protein
LPSLDTSSARVLAWGRTLRAAVLLMAAQLLIAALPFRLWRKWLGGRTGAEIGADAVAARRFAAQVERAARRLPWPVKCLPQSMALSWLLRHAGIAHKLVFAARPPGHRDGSDDLHAWIDVDGKIVLGDLPGPWLRILDQGS